MIRDLDPQAPTLEGYLFPNTYKLSRHTTPERLCHIMTGKFREVWKRLERRAGRARHRHAGVAGGKGRQARRGAAADRGGVRAIACGSA